MKEGDTLTAVLQMPPGQTAPSELGYTWFADGTPIDGATGQSLLLTQAQVGKAITASVSAAGTTLATSGATNEVFNINTPVSDVSVSFSGGNSVGDTITAVVSYTDPDGEDTSVSVITWNAAGAAAGNTYTLTEADQGSTISVDVTFTEIEYGSFTYMPRFEDVGALRVNHSPTGSVTLGGTARQGELLSAVTDSIADQDGLGTLAYQWLRDGVEISGATAASHLLTQADVGARLTVQVSYEDDAGTQESLSAQSARVENVNDAPTGSVSVTGTARQGEVLSVTTTLADADGLGALSTQWLRDGTAITGATGGTYTLTQADVGAQISARVSYTDGFSQAEAVTSAATSAVENVNDDPGGAVSITGTARQGQVLTVQQSLGDADGLGTLAYQWLRDGAAIAGATSASVVLGQADVGAAISVRLSYTDGEGAQEAVNSAPTAPVENVNDAPQGAVAIAGQAVQGQTLTALVALSDTDGLGSVSYQWRADGADITGATGPSFAPGQAEVGAAITLRVSYTDGGGTQERVTSSATAAVENVNDAPTGSVSVSGTARQGEVLSVTYTLADADGLGELSTQWLRDGAAIPGATGSTYTLTQADVGAQISARVSYTDGGGTQESVTSIATAAVEGDGSQRIGTPLADWIDGTDEGEVISGLGGNDTLTGLGGNDTLLGGAGDDSVVGGAGDDVLNGGDPESLSNADGSDAFVGGDGIDWVSYDGSFGSLRVDLMFPQINTFAGRGDTYDGIENLLGSQGPDNMRGDQGGNHIMGGRNVDYLFGRRGNDTLEGGVGDDVLFGGVGEDVLIGGANRDRAQYSEAITAIAASLADTGLNTGEAAGDSYDSIEDLAGGRFADTLYGDTGSNRLFGREDNDTLIAGAGDDYLNGGGNNDRLEGGAGDDTLRGGTSRDTFVFNDGADVVEDWFLDIIELDGTALGVAGLSGGQVVTQLGSVAGSDFVLDFDNGVTLTLQSQSGISLTQLAGFIEIA